MCGQMSLFAPQTEIEIRFGATAIEPLGRRYNFAPGDDFAVIQNDAGSAPRRASPPAWQDGFVWALGTEIQQK